MARLKRIVKSALEDRSPRFLLATIALGVAISLIAGMAIGYKVEQSRAKPVKRVAAGDHEDGRPPSRSSRSRPRPTSPAPSSRRSARTSCSSSTARRSTARFVLGPKTRIAVGQAHEGVEHRGGIPRGVPAELGEPHHGDRGRRAARRGADRGAGDRRRAGDLDDAQDPEGLGNRRSRRPARRC